MTRTEIEVLLPFLANDTLTGTERAQVQAAVDADPALQGQLAALRAIRHTMQADMVQSPGELGLARLMRDLDAAPAIAPDVTPARTAWLARPRVWQGIAAALLAVVVAQGLLSQRGGTDPGGMRLASGPAAALSVAFAPDTPESALRALLHEAGARIVDGPSALGFYDLAPQEGVTVQQMRAVLAGSTLIDSLSAPDHPD